MNAASVKDFFIMEHLQYDHYKLNFHWIVGDKEEWKIKLNI